MAQFLWRVNQNGYCWIEAIPQDRRHDPKAQPELFLTARKETSPPNLYDSLDRKKLFRKFANTPPTKEGILDFANEFGMLGPGSLIPFRERIREIIILSPMTLGSGESFIAWQIAILVMQQAVTLWDMVQNEDIDGLSKHVQWDGKAALYNSHPELSPQNMYYGSFNFQLGRGGKPPVFHNTRKFVADANNVEFFESGFSRKKSWQTTFSEYRQPTGNVSPVTAH